MFKALNRLIAYITGENKEAELTLARKQALRDAQLHAEKEQSKAAKKAVESNEHLIRRKNEEDRQAANRAQESKTNKAIINKNAERERNEPPLLAKYEVAKPKEKPKKNKISSLFYKEDFWDGADWATEIKLSESENLFWEIAVDPDLYCHESFYESESEPRDFWDDTDWATEIELLESESLFWKTVEEEREWRYEIEQVKSKRGLVTTPERLIKKLLPSVETQKKDWFKFQQVLKKHNISRLYHFTDRENLASIRAAGGLLSWYSCKENSISIARPGGSEFSWQLDARKGLADYVRLSFIHDHPMMYIAKQDGRLKSPILLEIDPAVILLQPTKFSLMNAAKSGVTATGDLEKFMELKFDVFRKKYFDLTDEEKPYYQAEILIHRMLPAKYILNLDQLPV
ncbi:DarT ssDNA thymidine ADP-ribosyltransferase family protein [Hymenobacter baengnokdamensis]|uniref:DarT ssDNA thymidine ADP-ribosyltransferase family protein n=1 Tax=Hymenobacter baengnokdamensis TaxID=2615203 RepID=UPI0012459043|nr:DarT ssDNA thymidine ADP-ribosyltransferase family protein [Hymenobacter baengnokdamensis]